MIHVKRPADPLDLLAFQLERGRRIVSMRAHVHMHVQIFGGPSCAVYREGHLAPAALAGIYPGPRGPTAWFDVAPIGSAALGGVVLSLRRALRMEVATGLWPRIVAEIEAGNAAGERLARALGFVLNAATEAESVREWVLTGGSHENGAAVDGRAQ